MGNRKWYLWNTEQIYFFKPQYNETIRSLKFCKLRRQANENVEEWMGRIRVEPLECNYKDIDRQMKKQFIHRLNGSDTLTEIIRKLIKTNHSMHITSEQVLAWAKKWGPKSPGNRHELPEWGGVWQNTNSKDDLKQNGIKMHTPVKMPTRKICKYCDPSHQHIWCPAYGKKYIKCNKRNHFWEVCINVKSSVVYNREQEADREKEYPTKNV